MIFVLFAIFMLTFSKLVFLVWEAEGSSLAVSFWVEPHKPLSLFMFRKTTVSMCWAES